MANFREEFPDFDPATLPKIPKHWVDDSWHNDACPKWNTELGTIVFVDYADIALREIQDSDGKRYSVQNDPELTDDNDELFASDDWEAVLAFVDQHAEENCEGHTDTGRGVCAHCGKVLI